MFTRDPHNPVLVPRAGLDEAAVFNPGAVVLGGTLFLLPRVRRLSTRESFFGLAWAARPGDPFQRLDHPIMVGSAPYERPMLGRPRETGGVEDCRITVIGRRLFLVYTAFHQRCHLALASIEIERFLSLWRRSREQQGLDLSAAWDRSWTRLGPLFPEMLDSDDDFTRNGCLFFHRDAGYCLLYRRRLGEIELARSDRPQGPYRPTGAIVPRDLPWESDRIGISTTPLELDSHRLLFLYHGVQGGPAASWRDHQRIYHLGALTARLRCDDEPEVTLEVTKLSRPVLSPELEYEVDVSDWLANDAIRVAAVFACGMVRWGGQVLVPYGAGDHQVCLGTLDPGPLSSDSRRLRR
jgi:predicted GH43/DUF377 family glycosyl hydrolase